MSDVYLRYVGHGFIVGVPKRDLTFEEARRFGVQKLLDSKLYAKAGAPASTKPRPSADKSLAGPSEDKGE